jgi:hypothetical protein
MIGGLTATDLLLIQAADAGDLQVRASRGCDEDDRPEGWPVIVYRDRVCTVDDECRLESLESAGYLMWDDEGPVQVTAAGRDAIR